MHVIGENGSLCWLSFAGSKRQVDTRAMVAGTGLREENDSMIDFMMSMFGCFHVVLHIKDHHSSSLHLTPAHPHAHLVLLQPLHITKARPRLPRRIRPALPLHLIQHDRLLTHISRVGGRLRPGVA